jgi:hypothetical protein
MNQTIEYTNKTFEDIKHINEYGHTKPYYEINL